METDEWLGYCWIAEGGFTNHTVNHKNNFVDPSTGCHTQAIERAWADAKVWLQCARHGGPILQSHHDECAWRKLNSTNPAGLFDAFSVTYIPCLAAIKNKFSVFIAVLEINCFNIRNYF